MTKMTSLQTQRRHKVPDMNDSFCPRAAGFQERVQQYSGQDRPALRVKQSDEEKSSFADVARCLGWEMPTSRSRMVLRNYRQHQKRRCSMHRKPRADSIHVPRSRKKLDKIEMYEGLCFRKSWPVLKAQRANAAWGIRAGLCCACACASARIQRLPTPTPVTWRSCI